MGPAANHSHSSAFWCCADLGLQRGSAEELCGCGIHMRLSSLRHAVLRSQAVCWGLCSHTGSPLICGHRAHAVIYLVDISECPDFNTMYELYDPCTCMFFFRNKVTGTLLCGLPQLDCDVSFGLAHPGISPEANAVIACVHAAHHD